ncbi:MAG TPA: hypothetical protein EYP23_04935 [Thermoplasmata archaeon]|nr:hypothetical protein [Thermoplasmata archaeon]
MLVLLASAPIVTGNVRVKFGDGFPVSQVTLPSEGVIEPNPFSNGEGSSSSDPDAPVVKYLWVLPDEERSSVRREAQIHITPNGIREDAYAYAVVNDTEGGGDIQDVIIQVFYPTNRPPRCGSDKIKLHPVKLDPYDADDRETIEKSADDALAAGLIDKEEHTDVLYEIFDKPGAYMYRAQILMEYCEPCGVYKVDM